MRRVDRVAAPLLRRYCGGTAALCKKKAFDIDKDVFDPLQRPKQHPYITGNMRYMPGFSFPAPRQLESIVKYALLERESPGEIKMIWERFHESRKDCVASVIDKGTYLGFRERAAKWCVQRDRRLRQLRALLPCACL
jgi:hypothetical protein